MADFYLTLPSTASSEIYANTQSFFRVQLPQTIELDGEWSVGLSEIHIPCYWNNIADDINKFVLHVKQIPGVSLRFTKFIFKGKGVEPYMELAEHIMETLPENLKPLIKINVVGGKRGLRTEITKPHNLEFLLNPQVLDILGVNRTINFSGSDQNSINIPADNSLIYISYPAYSRNRRIPLKIPEGLYKNVEQILQAMRNVIPIDYDFAFTVNRDETVSLRCNFNTKIELFGENGLGAVLGFPANKVPLTSNVTGEYSSDIRRGVYGLYVYSSLIQPHIVGDVFAPLLRVIPTQEGETTSQTYTKIYTSPDYYPLLQNSFESVEIEICSDTGQRLKFRNGKTLVKLHFKIVL